MADSKHALYTIVYNSQLFGSRFNQDIDLGATAMSKPKKRKQVDERLDKEPSSPQKKRRGRPEKPLKIDDTPENVARALFGLPPIKATCD